MDFENYYQAEFEAAFVRDLEWQMRDESLSSIATPKQVRCPRCKDVFDTRKMLDTHFQPCLQTSLQK
jgi:hypothetical protein